MKRTTPVSSRLYAQRYGAECPVCESHELSVCGSPQNDGASFYQDIGCDNCGATWTDVYELTGYDDLQPKEIE